MKKITIVLVTIMTITFTGNAQTAPEWMYVRPSNTGVGGDYLQCIEVDGCGNKWTGGYLPFWSEGSVARFNDTTWTNWSNFEGYLPADRVYDVAFDNNGGLWVASNGVGNGVAHGGISHYDGTTWTSYTSANSPLPYDDMRGIAVDNNNIVWATYWEVGSSNSGGIAKFDGTNWTIYNPTNSGLQSSQVDKIDVDAQNNVWIGTNLGLVKFDGLNWILYHSQNSGITSNNIRDVEYDETTGKIYASTGLSIDIFDGINWTHINSSNAPVSSGGLWAVDARGDSVIITTIGGTYETYIYDGINWVSHPEMDHTYDARIDKDGNFWICGIGFLEKYDGSSWTTYSGSNTGLASMFNNDVFVDSNNRAWFGSSGNGGINMFDCPNWQDYNPYNFNLWPSPISYTGLGTGITEDSYGDIWMVFNGVAGGVVQVDNGDVNNPAAWHVWDNANSGVSLQFLNRAAADQSGNVWFGYDDVCSVSKFSQTTNSWTNYNLFQLGQNSCGVGSGVQSIRVDDSNNVWVCGLAGLAKFDQVNWTFYSHLNTPMLQGYVNDIAFDAMGNKWIATENGLYKFDNVSWTKYDSGNSPMLGNNSKAVLVDNTDKVWVASGDLVFPYPSGLFSFDGTSWTTYTPANSGLPEKYVIRLALDTTGNIWVLTETKGAALFNPDGILGYSCMEKNLQACVTTDIPEVSTYETGTAMVYPNPFTSGATVVSFAEMPGKASIIIYDVSGKIVKRTNGLLFTRGYNTIDIDRAGLKNGIYHCEIHTNSNIQNLKLVIQ